MRVFEQFYKNRIGYRQLGATLALALLLTSTLPARHALGADKSALASRLYQRLAGVPLPLNDPKRAQMEAAIQQGQLSKAAEIAGNTPSFFGITLKHWASSLSNRDENPLVSLNDFIALIVGVAHENRDAREILYGDFAYVFSSTARGLASGADGIPPVSLSNNNHYSQGEGLLGSGFADYLERVSPQRPGFFPDAAGVLTTRSWGESHLSAGTNRRPIAFAFREFLCAPIDTLHDISVPDYHVRRDVDRAPGGDASVYKSRCVGCHAGMDAMAGAYAHYEWDPTVFEMHYTGYVADKMNKNSAVFPKGFVTQDDSWTALWAVMGKNVSLGWPVAPGSPAPTGKGIHSLGMLLSNTHAFSTCMAKRAFRQVCNRQPYSADDVIAGKAIRDENADIEKLATDFETIRYQNATPYNLRMLFERAAVLPACLGN